MMNKNIFTKIAKKARRTNTSLRGPQLVHPNREWAIGLVVSILIFGAVAFWSVENYTKYDKISIEGQVNDDAEIVVYRENLVEAALKAFSERQIEHEQLLGGLSVDIDNEPINVEEVAGTDEDESTEVVESEAPDELVETESGGVEGVVE